MAAQTFSLQERIPHNTPDYLAQRLDGARDLYLLALALGERGDKAGVFGRMIQEARIHFAAVIEECRIAGLDTSAIAEMLGQMNTELDNSIRPELWERVEQIQAVRSHQLIMRHMNIRQPKQFRQMIVFGHCTPRRKEEAAMVSNPTERAYPVKVGRAQNLPPALSRWEADMRQGQRNGQPRKLLVFF